MRVSAPHLHTLVPLPLLCLMAISGVEGAACGVQARPHLSTRIHASIPPIPPSFAFLQLSRPPCALLFPFRLRAGRPWRSWAADKSGAKGGEHTRDDDAGGEGQTAACSVVGAAARLRPTADGDPHLASPHNQQGEKKKKERTCKNGALPQRVRRDFCFELFCFFFLFVFSLFFVFRSLSFASERYASSLRRAAAPSNRRLPRLASVCPVDGMCLLSVLIPLTSFSLSHIRCGVNCALVLSSFAS